jgi:predicted metal-binding protein
MMAVNRSVVGSGPMRCPGKSCLKAVDRREGVGERVRVIKVVRVNEKLKVRVKVSVGENEN